MESKTQLMDIVDSMITEGTFGLEALEGIKRIKDEASKAQETITTLEGQVASLDKALKQSNEIVLKQSSVIETLTNKVNEQYGIVENGQKAIYEAEKEKAVSAAYIHIMETIFKPHTVRQAIHKNVAIPIDGGTNYPGHVVQHPESGTIVTEEG